MLRYLFLPYSFFLYSFHNILLLFVILYLCFFDNKLIVEYIYSFLQKKAIFLLINYYEKQTFLKKADFRYISDFKGANTTNDMSTGDLIKAIYTYLQKKKQDTITEILKGLELTHLAERQNISTSDVDEIRRLNNMSHNDLKKIAKLRNIIKYGTLSREDLVYTLIRSEKAPHENNYMKYIQNNEIEKIKDKIKDKIKIIKIKLLKLEIIIKKNCKILQKKKKKSLQKHKKIIYTITSLKLREILI